MLNDESSIEDSYGHKKEHDEKPPIETPKAKLSKIEKDREKKQTLEQLTLEAVTSYPT